MITLIKWMLTGKKPRAKVVSEYNKKKRFELASTTHQTVSREYIYILKMR